MASINPSYNTWFTQSNPLRVEKGLPKSNGLYAEKMQSSNAPNYSKLFYVSGYDLDSLLLTDLSNGFIHHKYANSPYRLTPHTNLVEVKGNWDIPKITFDEEVIKCSDLKEGQILVQRISGDYRSIYTSETFLVTRDPYDNDTNKLGLVRLNGQPIIRITKADHYLWYLIEGAQLEIEEM